MVWQSHREMRLICIGIALKDNNKWMDMNN
jgi:hypothetical protein